VSSVFTFFDGREGKRADLKDGSRQRGGTSSEVVSLSSKIGHERGEDFGGERRSAGGVDGGLR